MYLPQSQEQVVNNVEGAADVVVCMHEDGTMASTPFIVKFLAADRSEQVKIFVNDLPTPVRMSINHRHQACFLLEESDLLDSFGNSLNSPIGGKLASGIDLGNQSND
jgi:phosphatidate phosphatase PAH1